MKSNHHLKLNHEKYQPVAELFTSSYCLNIDKVGTQISHSRDHVSNESVEESKVILIKLPIKLDL